MARHKIVFTDDEIEQAKRLRREGYGWRRVAIALGCNEVTIRDKLDPIFHLRRSELAKGSKSLIRVEPLASREDAARTARNIQPDTRSLLARFMGDPPPGRSALDQKARGQLSFPRSPYLSTPLASVVNEPLTVQANSSTR